MTDVQFAAAHTGAPPAWNATTTCITADVAQGLDALAKYVAIGAGVAAAPVLIPAAAGVASTLPLMGVMATNALSTLPAWVSPALTVAGTLPGVYSNTKCLTHPELCTAQDQMNTFMTGVGVQQLIEQQAIQSLGAQDTTASQLELLKQQIKQQIAAGDTSGTVATTLANQKIDELISQGVDEFDAITQVGSAIVPDYAITPEQKALLGLADKARTADEVMQCSYTWCRQNSVVSDAILSSRGLDPQRVTMTMQDVAGLSAGGHHLSSIIVNGEPVFIDFTNNLTVTGQQALEQIFKDKGLILNTLQLNGLQAPYTVTNLLP